MVIHYYYYSCISCKWGNTRIGVLVMSELHFQVAFVWELSHYPSLKSAYMPIPWGGYCFLFVSSYSNISYGHILWTYLVNISCGNFQVNLGEKRAVTAVLVLCGLPYASFSSILAHEAMHAAMKLDPSFPTRLPSQVILRNRRDHTTRYSIFLMMM